jgi:hypothetical protein
MKRTVAVLAVLVMLSATVVPSYAGGGHGHGHFHGGCCAWWPGAVLGGLFLGAALGTALTYPYYPSYPYYAAPPVVYQSPAVYPSPAYTGQVYVTSGSTYTTTPTVVAPQVQREVVYSNGRYVLHGDGVNQLWEWVWVPAGPPPPPPRQ